MIAIVALGFIVYWLVAGDPLTRATVYLMFSFWALVFLSIKELRKWQLTRRYGKDHPDIRSLDYGGADSSEPMFFAGFVLLHYLFRGPLFALVNHFFPNGKLL